MILNVIVHVKTKLEVATNFNIGTNLLVGVNVLVIAGEILNLTLCNVANAVNVKYVIRNRLGQTRNAVVNVKKLHRVKIPLKQGIKTLAGVYVRGFHVDRALCKTPGRASVKVKVYCREYVCSVKCL